MDILGDGVALAIGTAVPLAALAMVVRWRMAVVARRASSINQRRADERKARRPGRQARLQWLASLRTQFSAGDPMATTGPMANQCRLCGHMNTDGAIYCRRCGTSLLE